MLAPVSRLRLADIRWLAKHHCRHGHTYLAHYNCFVRDNPLKQKIAFFDIETSNLKADYGIMFCYCLLDNDTGDISSRILTKKELEKNLDKEVTKQCVEDISKYDRLVTYYGSQFDLPFVRSRALYWDIDFPAFGEINHDDMYFLIKGKFCLSRNRMENACRTLLGKTEKTHIDANHWIRALQGNKESLDWILDHCKRDVRDLQRLHQKVVNYSKKKDSSI